LENYPNFKSDKFQCPHCQSIAQQRWFDSYSASSVVNKLIQYCFLDYRSRILDYQQKAIERHLNTLKQNLHGDMQNYIPDNLAVATCTSCNEVSLWISKKMVYPRKTALPPPNADLEDEISVLYQEAATIYADSPRGASALLRLALQKLLKQIGKEGKNINQDIKDLVSDGLSPKIQQALDLVRVVGNNAVHPGQINLDDNSDVALKLFQILNFVAEELITKPKELEALYNETVPEETREQIRQRDES